jgi:hypothetical protein
MTILDDAWRILQADRLEPLYLAICPHEQRKRSAIIDVVNRTKAERQELADVDSALVFGIEFDCLEKFAGRARFRRAHRSLCAGPWRQGLRKSSSPVQVRTQI